MNLNTSIYSYLIQHSNFPEHIKKIKPPSVYEYLNNNKISQRNTRLYKHYKKFAVVRNPYARMWSCYQDKIIAHKVKNWELRYGFRRYNDLFGRKLFSFDMTFDDFVRSICLIPEIISDEHFRSQCRFLKIKKNKIDVDFLLRFETLDRDISSMCDQLNLPAWANSHLNVSSSSIRKIAMSIESSRLLQRRYKRDFRVLNYSTQLSNLG